MDAEEALSIIYQNRIFGIFVDSTEYIHFLAKREMLRYDFIPQYRDFFETLDFCGNFLLLNEGYPLWLDGKQSPKHGAYIPAQCENMDEFLAYLLQRIKFFPYLVHLSLNGNFGDAELYQRNLDLALQHGWITQEDYDTVVNEGNFG